jgi:hypothetical protein
VARKFLTPVGLPTGATLPTGAAGELFYLTTDSTVYLHNGTSWSPVVGDGMPAGGTEGQILAKVDGTNYNTEWIDNYTGQIKHLVKLGESITKGQAVYVSSATGTNMIVSKASNATEAASSKTMGLLETGGVLNDQVYVVTEGLLAGLNTNTATAGDPVWLGTSGNLIYGLANKPVAPAHLVYLGVVTRVSATVGEIFVHVQNGFELRELHTVLLEADASIADNEVLAYDTTSSLWKNQTASEAGLAALSGASFTGDVSTTGNVTASGNLRSTNSSADEGGEIFLNKSVTNTTLTGGVTIDVWQNRLRFFEQGGNARGYYIDISTGADSVGTNLVGGGGGSGTVTSIATTSPLTGGTITTTGTIGINASSANTANYVVQRDASGNFSAGTITATFSGSGAALTNLPAANVTGTLTSTVLGNSAVFIGTTSVALNRTTANLALTGISSVTLPGSTSGTIQLLPTAIAGTGTVLTLPATTGTLALTSQLPTVNNATLTLAVSGVGLSGAQTFTANQSTGATFTVTSNANSANGVSTIVARDASGGFAAGAITGISFNSITGLSSTTPSAPGTAAVGTATTAARADHVHPTTGLGLTSGTLAQFAATTSSQLAGVISDETGSGALVFGTSPTLTTSLATASVSFDLIDTGATTVNFARAATALTAGATTGTLTLRNPTIATSVTSGTLALFNTGLTGTLSIGGATGTINIGSSTTTKTVNIATATTVGNSSTVRIGTNEGSGTTSDIYLQGQIYAGKSVSTTGTATGTATSVFGPPATATGTSGNAVGGNLTILSGSASIVDEVNVSGTSTSGNLILDVGTATTAGGGTTAGNVQIGTTRAASISLGRTGVSVTTPGAITATQTITGGNLTTSGSLTRTALALGGTTGASINDSGAFIRTSSSARYKQDIQDASYVYEEVLSLQPKTFRLKEEAESNESARFYGGLIAEEVDQLDSLRVFVNYITSEDGDRIPDGINYGEMVSALVSALKHQNTLIQALEARVQQLEG